MKDTSINEGFHDRIEYAEKLFKQSLDYKESLQQWEILSQIIEGLMKDNKLQKEVFLLEDLVQTLFLGAAKYGYMTGYQDAKHHYIESVYFEFIQRLNKEYTVHLKDHKG